MHHLVSSWNFGAHHTPGMLHLVFNHSWLVFLFITYYKYPFLKCAVRPHDHELCQHLIDTMEMWWVGVMSAGCLQLYWKVKVKQAPLSMEFFRQEYWSGFLFLSPGDLLDPGIKPRSPELQADSLPSEPPGIEYCIKVFSHIEKPNQTESSKKESALPHVMKSQGACFLASACFSPFLNSTFPNWLHQQQRSELGGTRRLQPS